MTSQLIQKAVSEVEKMKKNSEGETIPYYFASYNEAISDVQSLLPQIITGVIEEIEKMVEGMKDNPKNIGRLTHFQRISDLEALAFGYGRAIEDMKTMLYKINKNNSSNGDIQYETSSDSSSLKEVVKE